MFDDLIPSNSSAGASRIGTNTADVKAWAIKHWRVPEEATLLVSELQCGEKDCPDVETVIAILAVEGADKTVKLKKSIHEIKEVDIQNIDIWR